MKITVSRSLLSDALRKVQSLASGKNSMPILSNVKMQAQGDKVTFTTTDLDLSSVYEITCNVVEEGGITLPAKLMSDAIAHAPEGDVSIDVTEATNKAVVKAGTSVFRLTGLPATEFPTLPVADGEPIAFSLPQEVLKGLIRRTAYAMSKDDTRRVLKGVFFKFADGFLTVVATDGRRLSIAEYHPETPYALDVEFILPEKAIAELMRNLGNSGIVTFALIKSQIKATFDGGMEIYSKLLDDTYPNYKQVIPLNNDLIVSVDRNLLVSAIERVGIFAEEHSMKFTIINNEIQLSSATEIGNSDEAVPVKYDGEEIKATFNHEYILDALKSIDDDEIVFCFKSGTAPVIIKGSSEGLALVMPLRVND